MGKHKLAKLLHRLFHFGRHADIRDIFAVYNHIVNQRIQTLPGRKSQGLPIFQGNILLGKYPAPDGIVNIMINIGDLIRESHYFSFQRMGTAGRAVVQYPVPDLHSQIQANSLLLQHFHDPHALFKMGKAAAAQPVQHRFPHMAEGRMPQIMSQRHRFRQILIQAQRLGDGSGDLRHLQRMGQARPVVISLGSQKDLGFMLQPPK